MDQPEDQLLHLYWKERSPQANIEDDIIIFPGEATFNKVSQCTTGRVYLLKFNNSNEKHFYWMQNKSDGKDQEYANSVNELIGDSEDDINMSAELDENTSHAEIMRLLNPSITEENVLEFLNNMSRSRRPQSEENRRSSRARREQTEDPTPVTTTTATTTTATTTTATPDPALPQEPNPTPAVPTGIEQGDQPDYGQLAQMLTNFSGQQRGMIALTDILNNQSLTPLLNDDQICESLTPYLPEQSEKSAEEVRQVVRSPQFSQALQTLTVALQTGQLGPLLSLLGLDSSAGYGVEAFLNAIEKQAKEKRGDEMEED
ncbi:hypothetical protein G6F43_000068 [Rhizopus delemar]|nr:hypothetical protein G6F43_000068 [Rhizopus delemar]